jgi:biotin carboxylase
MVRNLVFVAPFPSDVTMRFVRAAARLQGVRLLGVVHTLPTGKDKDVYDDFVRVERPLETSDLIAGIDELKRRHGAIFRIIGILEAQQVQLGELRAHFGVEGMSAKTADLFRDKSRMKAALAKAGLPVARNKLVKSLSDGTKFTKEVGFPIVLKPPAGMGSKSTYRMRDDVELADAIASLHISKENPVLAEEFLRGTEYSFETVTIDGKPQVHSISHYTPSCLEAVENPWIQWCCYLPRDISGPEYDDARKLGFAAVKALGLKDGITHMEWFRRDDGTLAIGEIAARPPGANISIMNAYAHDVDFYRAWVRAVVDGAFDGPWERKYAVGTAFLRGAGRGRVAGVSGLTAVYKELGVAICEAKIPDVGAPKNDSYEGEGYIVVRNPDTEVVKRMLKFIVNTVRVHYAG